ncbi:hypothetical protein [Litorivivens sp.]|uniref:hypothetical protein n=1 Tax=Litorivivens sp. TaxID=2020868 RepID=UPI003566197C
MSLSMRLTLALSAALLMPAAVMAATPHCAFPGAREIPAASLYITDSTAFDSYRFVWIEDISFNNPESLSHQEQGTLRKLIRSAIEQEWLERLGWRSANAPGDAVASLSINVEDLTTDTGQLHLHTRLRDSVSGEQLMAQCDAELALDSEHYRHTTATSLAWNGLRQQVSHWGAGLGSHLMTVY